MREALVMCGFLFILVISGICFVEGAHSSGKKALFLGVASFGIFCLAILFVGWAIDQAGLTE
jgi:predicted cobalt transporter CbtA